MCLLGRWEALCCGSMRWQYQRLRHCNLDRAPCISQPRRRSPIAFSPSGQQLQLLSGSEDCTVRLWNCQTGSTNFILEGHTDQKRGVAFSPSGDQVASASDDKTVRLWDLHTGNNINVLYGHTGPVCGVAYSPNEQSIVSRGEDGTIRFFDTRYGRMGWVLNGRGLVRCVAFSPDGNWVAAGYFNGQLQLWDVRTSPVRRQWLENEVDVNAVAFSPDSRWIASSREDCKVKLWDIHTGTLVSVFAGHSDLVTCVAFSPNGLQLASGSWDETVRLWDVTTTGAGHDADTYQADNITGVAYSYDGRILISGGGSGTVRLYDAVTGNPCLVLQCGSRDAWCVAFSLDGFRVATAGRDRVVRTWNAEFGALEFTFKGHTGNIVAMTFSPDDQWIASGSRDNTVCLWCARSGTPGCVLSGHSDWVKHVTFSPCGLNVVSGGSDGTVRVWDIGTGESRVIVNVWCDLMDISISSTAKQIALVRTHSTEVELWDEECGEPLHTLKHDGVIFFVSLSPCGQWIASTFDGVMLLWHLVRKGAEQEWDHVLAIGNFLSGVSCVAWRPNKLEFVASSSSGFVQVWRLAEESDGTFSARLIWTLGCTALAAANAVIVDVVGLSETNQRLLKQRDAKDGSKTIDDTMSDSQDESQDDYPDEDQDDYSDENEDDYLDGSHCENQEAGEAE